MNTSQPTQSTRFVRFLAILLAGILITTLAAHDGNATGVDTAPQTAAYIVQAADLETAVTAVQAVGGDVTHELSIINAAGARLTVAQKAQLEADEQVVQLFADSPVQVNAPGGPNGPGKIVSVDLPVIADNELWSGHPDGNLGDWNGMDIGSFGPSRSRGLLRVDLSAIPPNAHIIKADLNLYVVWGGRGGVNVHPVTSDWGEYTSTWHSTAEAYDSSQRISFNPRHNHRFYSLNLKHWVQSWVDGSMPNYGVMLIGQRERGNRWYEFASRENANSDIRPHLTVRYRLKPGPADGQKVAGSAPLHAQANLGAGVTVASIDTGWLIILF